MIPYTAKREALQTDNNEKQLSWMADLKQIFKRNNPALEPPLSKRKSSLRIFKGAIMISKEPMQIRNKILVQTLKSIAMNRQ
jgi:hypothetical protein